MLALVFRRGGLVPSRFFGAHKGFPTFWRPWKGRATWCRGSIYLIKLIRLNLWVPQPADLETSHILLKLGIRIWASGLRLSFFSSRIFCCLMWGDTFWEKVKRLPFLSPRLAWGLKRSFRNNIWRLPRSRKFHPPTRLSSDTAQKSSFYSVLFPIWKRLESPSIF